MLAFDTADYTPSDFTFNWDYDAGWRGQARRIYNGIRYPVLDFLHRPLIPQTNDRYHPDLVLGRGVGMPRSATRRRLTTLMGNHPVKHLLVLGCGSAWDFGQWLRFQPQEVIGVDLYSFRRAWTEVKTAAQRHSVSLDFIQADITDLGQIRDEWADVVITDAVFEHCVDLEAALGEARRKTRPGGLIYASYGPLWYSPSGDHFSYRGGLAHAYNHLILNDLEYRDFFSQYIKPDEDPQNGGRYVPLGLFSRLSSDQYLALYERLHLKRRFLAIAISPLAPKFKARYPGEWKSLGRLYPGFREEEFYIMGHYVVLER